MDDEIHEECGIAAVYIKPNGNKEAANRALFYLYKLLLNLQNRGQLSAGITTYNPERTQILDTYRDLGPVNEVFRTSNKPKSMQIFQRYSGSKGIGHVRYATSGSDDRGSAQPFERHHGRTWKWFAFGFNGNLANYAELKKKVEGFGYHIVYDTDTEIMMHLIAKELGNYKKKPNLVHVFSSLAKKFDGSYNITYIDGDGDMIIARDPYGFRPLVYSIDEKQGVFLAASESNALINCGMKSYKPLPPGHLIHVSNGKISIKKFAESKRKAHCMFEWVYFSNVSSVNDDRSVYLTRARLGKELAKSEPIKPNKDFVVVPVPDTAKAAADAFAFELGIPSVEGLMRNRYVGRTFIEGGSRHERIQNKYTALREVLEGKKVFLVDDSIVRGSTTQQLVRYIKDMAGAREVHMRITCPPIRGPCFYGIDMSTIAELLIPKYEKKFNPGEISNEVCRKIAQDAGADSLRYQTIKGLISAIDLPSKELCLACINRNYPTLWGKKLIQKAEENFRKGIKDRTYSC